MTEYRRRRNVTMGSAPSSIPGSLRPTRVRQGIKRQPWGLHAPKRNGRKAA